MAKKVLFVLMPEQYQDFEFRVPYTHLIKKGYSVDVAGLRAGQATGTFGDSFTPNLQLSSFKNQDFDVYDAIIIPGGPGSTKYLWENKKLQEIVTYFNTHHKLVATICYACAVPAQAGILNNKRATIYPTEEAKELFKKLGITFINEGCIVLAADNIITAQGPTYAQQFADAITNHLEK